MDQDTLFKQYKGVFDEEVETPKEKKEKTYEWSPFALQDAIGARDIKKMWIENRKLVTDGISTEDIIHKIVSKVREMIAISFGASKEDLNIKNDYPYSKSKKDAKNWKIEELKKLYTKLVSVYHLSRLPKSINVFSDLQSEPLDIALEKTILSL